MADALFPRVRQRGLGILFGNPGRSYFAAEVMDLAQSGRGAVHRELTDLAAAGLLKVSMPSRGITCHGETASSPVLR